MTDKKVIDYDVVTSDSLTTLVFRVKELVRLGWKPVGGVSHLVYETTISYRTSWSQAIIKYEE